MAYLHRGRLMGALTFYSLARSKLMNIQFMKYDADGNTVNFEGTRYTGEHRAYLRCELNGSTWEHLGHMSMATVILTYPHITGKVLQTLGWKEL